MTVSASDRAPAASTTVSLLDWIPAAWRTVRTDVRPLLRGLIGLLRLRPTKLGSIGQTFALQAARHPDRPALVCGERHWTYAEFNAWANRCAHALKAAGVRPGMPWACCWTTAPRCSPGCWAPLSWVPSPPC